jgi:small ligand-binding sensory domain FIST
VLVFATTPHGPGFTRVTRTVGEVCGTHQIVGCSAAGVLAGQVEVENAPGVAVLALSGDLAARRFFVPFSPRSGERVADDIADALGETATTPSLLVLFADCYNLDPEPLLRGLARRMPGVPIVGGGASEDGSVGQVSVFAGDAVSSSAVSGVLFGGELRATAGVTHGVRRVGAVHRVTGVRGNVVLTLDGRPAYEVFASLVPESLLEDARRALALVLVGFPYGEGQYVIRHLVGLDPRKGHLVVAAPVSEGQELFFGVRDPQAARADLQGLLEQQGSAWPARAAGALYVNCIARGERFHGVPGLETAYIGQHLGALPVAGFFSGAEIAPGDGFSRLHQYTGVLTMIGQGT